MEKHRGHIQKTLDIVVEARLLVAKRAFCGKTKVAQETGIPSWQLFCFELRDDTEIDQSELVLGNVGLAKDGLIYWERIVLTISQVDTDVFWFQVTVGVAHSVKPL